MIQTVLFALLAVGVSATSKPDLVEVGSGVREATLLRVRVYRATLFVAEPSRIDGVLGGLAGDVRVDIAFLRHVDRSQGAKAWADAVAKSAGPLSPVLAAEIALLERWLPDVNEGDRLTFEWSPATGTRVASSATKAPLAASVAFGRAVLSMWIGTRPVDEKLKAGLLGRARKQGSIGGSPNAFDRMTLGGARTRGGRDGRARPARREAGTTRGDEAPHAHRFSRRRREHERTRRRVPRRQT